MPVDGSIQYLLRPFVLSYSSYVKDTINFSQIIEDLVVLPDAILETIDVESSYSSIPNSNGIKLFKIICDQGIQYSKALSNFVIPVLDFILRQNAFASTSSRCRSVAMGTCCAPFLHPSVPGGVGAIFFNFRQFGKIFCLYPHLAKIYMPFL